MSKNWILGIDFGTSNTAAAYLNSGSTSVTTVNLSHSGHTMPSDVYMETIEKIDVGDIARSKAESNPAGFVPSPKRLVHQQVFQINGYDVASAVPISAVLAAVIEKASYEHDGTKPESIVLTYPEGWSRNEVEVLRSAAYQLGYSADSVRMVSEPQAAARYYSEARELLPGQKIAVFDFGGGTLDIAVLEAQSDGAFSVIAARGDNALGGKSFDALIRKWVDARLEDDDPEVLDYLRRKAPLSERHALEDSIRRAKELLSEAPQATITIPTDSEKTIGLQITRTELEDIISPALGKAVAEVQATLSAAGIGSSGDLEALYLTGGSSRIPAVQEALKDVGPVATLDDPKTVVAKGALKTVDTHIGKREEKPMEEVLESANTEDNSSKNKKGKIFNKGVLAAIAVIVIAAVGITAINMNSNKSAEKLDIAVDQKAGSGSAEVEQDAATTSEILMQEILGAVPNSISDGLGECKPAVNDDDSDSPSYAIDCEVLPDGSLSKYFKPWADSYGTNTLQIYVAKDSTAQMKRGEIRDLKRDPSDEYVRDLKTIFDVDSPKAASLKDDKLYDDVDDIPSIKLEYVNAESGLILNSDYLRSVADGEKFLKDTGLI